MPPAEPDPFPSLAQAACTTMAGAIAEIDRLRATNARLSAELTSLIARFHRCCLTMGSAPEFADAAVAGARAALESK